MDCSGGFHIRKMFILDVFGVESDAQRECAACIQLIILQKTFCLSHIYYYTVLLGVFMALYLA